MIRDLLKINILIGYEIYPLPEDLYNLIKDRHSLKYIENANKYKSII